MIKRYLEENIRKDLNNKMVFISGPRQVGKTTLALNLGKEFCTNGYDYLNWDYRGDRRSILKSVFKADKEMLIFDEIHKYKNWKNYLKGQYDKLKDRYKILVMGSAHLDIYRKGGDSLLGRYYLYRLHPLTLNELFGRRVETEIFKELNFLEETADTQKIFESLFKFGGFPEPFTKQSEEALRRWHNMRLDSLIREDVRDIENLRDISALEVLAELIPEKVGSLFSLNSLREDLNVTHKTIASWVDVLERFYYHYRIYSYRNNLIKSLRKEPKIYLWDWSELQDEAAKFENLIASHLLKYCHFLFDSKGYKAKLYFLRDIEKREVDFLVTIDEKPWFCVEVKSAFKEVPNSLKYFKRKLKIPFAYEVVNEFGKDLLIDGVRVISANKFLTAFV